MTVVSDRQAPPADVLTDVSSDGGGEVARARGWPDPLTLAVACFFAGALSVLAALRHHQFGSSKYNLGNFTQAIWNTAHGRVFEATADTGEQMLRLGAHVEPILLLFAPLWRVWPSPLMLLTVQATALASGALPVYWLARTRLGSVSAGRLVALAYLLYPSIALLALHEFHAVTLAVPFLLYAVWYLETERFVPFAVWAVLAASTKEQIGLSIAGLGIWYVLTRRRYRVGATITAFGLAWSTVAFLVVIPHFSPDSANPYAGRYAAVGGNPEGILSTALFSPVEIMRALASSANAAYIVALILPVAAMCLLAPVALIPALPELVINLLSNHALQKTLTWQYVAGIVPFIFFATIQGISKRPGQTEFLTRVVAMAAVVTFLAFSPQMFSWFSEPTDRTSARQALSLIPDAVPVSTSGRLGAHLAERRRLLSFPIVEEADWIIVDRTDAWIPWPVERWDPERWEQAIRRYERNPNWRVVFARGDILVLRRRSGS